MKVDFFDNEIVFDECLINVLEIENKVYFYRFVKCLNEIVNNGFSEEVIFFEGDKEINVNGKIKLVVDYFNFGFDSKKYEKDIGKFVNEHIDEEDKNNLVNQYSKIVKIYNKLLNSIDLPLTVENEISVDNVTKLVKIDINCKNNVLENLFLMIDLERTLKTNNILFFVNLKQYLTVSEMIELYKYAIYNQVRVLLVDSQAYGCTMDYEKKLIIDENLDEYVL